MANPLDKDTCIYVEANAGDQGVHNTQGFRANSCEVRMTLAIRFQDAPPRIDEGLQVPTFERALAIAIGRRLR